MDAITFENLLNESESDYLDFKQDQYRFDGASEDEKSEILKDILAFANAWRRTDAYILIGVCDVKGGRSKVIGISKHIDDASLQQFINYKVQKPLLFSYSTFEVEGMQVGIIHIPVQDRPFYVKQQYGKVKPRTVYLRRGSSTAEADPDEIARMGAAMVITNQPQTPTIECEFGNPILRKLYGKEIDLTSTVLKVNEPIPDFSPKQNPLEFASKPNPNFYRELYNFYDFQYLLTNVELRVKNTGAVTAFNSRVELSIGGDELLLLKGSDFPDRPREYHNFLSPINERISSSAIDHIGSLLSIEKNGADWLITINFGSIQPKAESWLEEPIYIGSRKPQDLHFDAIIYADNIPDPIRIPLCIHLHTNEVVRTINELESDHEEILNKEMQKYFPNDS